MKGIHIPQNAVAWLAVTAEKTTRKLWSKNILPMSQISVASAKADSVVYNCTFDCDTAATAPMPLIPERAGCLSSAYGNSMQKVLGAPTKELADNTHFNPYGAYQVAKMVVMGMKQLNLPMVQHLKADFKDYDPKNPDDYTKFVWYNSAKTDFTKPDGN